jgi:hypothetical protein
LVGGFQDIQYIALLQYRSLDHLNMRNIRLLFLHLEPPNRDSTRKPL